MSSTRYLQQIGHSWYVRVKIPQALQGRLKNTHVRCALGTRDLAEANRLKWAVVAQIQSSFAGCVRGPAAASDQVAGVGSSPGDATTHSETLAVTAPVPLPQRLLRASSVGSATLDELQDQWLESADYLLQTKQQHRQAYGELRAFLGGNRSPEAMTVELAADYVEDHIKPADWSSATKRRKLSSLIAFWTWLGLRRAVPRGFNPWTGFRIGSKKGLPRTKRPHTEAELVQLFSRRPDYPGLADVMVLGLLTGMRLDEICALRLGDITRDSDGAYWIDIKKAKTRAGVRLVAMLHPHGTTVLDRRSMHGQSPDTQLFPEFRGGGYDGKLSWAVSKAFGRFRKQAGLTSATDFHSFRRTFITALENAGADQVQIARFVGHELPTLAFAVYSGGSTEATLRHVASLVKLPDAVSRVVERFVAE
jgi:integrase